MKRAKYALLPLLIIGVIGCDNNGGVHYETNAPAHVKRASRLIETYLRINKLKADCKAIISRADWLVACKPHRRISPFLIYSIREPDTPGDSYHIEAVNRAARSYANVGLFRKLKIQMNSSLDIDEEYVRHEYSLFAER